MNALLNVACVVNGHDASTVNRGCKGSNLVDLEDARVVERAVHTINVAQRRWVATLKAAKPNKAQH
jgi:hypothetical protein